MGLEKKKKIKSALISVYHKDGLDAILEKLNSLKIKMISTGGTADIIELKGYDVIRVESLTGYPSILGGRVKTLHPKVFGGILARRDEEQDMDDMNQYDIQEIDLVIVDLYPFEETLASGADHNEVIEKIDIGGISLIRAAAKNYEDVLIVSSQKQYANLLAVLHKDFGETGLKDRMTFAAEAFAVSSAYDAAIYDYFSEDISGEFRLACGPARVLRYGENPHQRGLFYGNFDAMFEQIYGKEISYNNLLDIDAAINLIDEFKETTFAVLKHNNACGLASRPVLKDAWKAALAGDPLSAYGGILVTNRKLDEDTALEINKLFYEIIVAPDYDLIALDILMQKKNRIILKRKTANLPRFQFRSLLNGVLWQERDRKTEDETELKVVTQTEPTPKQIADLLYANILVKHTKSNAIVLVKNRQLVASGTGQTSRVDALNQAVEKAQRFGFNLDGAVMASDAFFPFADSVEIAHKAGIGAVIQPGGSVRDQDSIDYCNTHGLSMVFTGVRHFKH